MAGEFSTKDILNESDGAVLLKQKIAGIVSELDLTESNDTIANALGMVAEPVETIDGTFTTMLGTSEMEEIGEQDEFPLDSAEQGYVKGYKLKRYGKKTAITKTIRKWFEVYQKGAAIDSSVKKEITELAKRVKRLVTAAKITKAYAITELLTKGFTKTAANGEGSGSPDGQPLFSASHVIKSTGATQSNLVTGALSQAKLLEAIELLRNMRDGMGRLLPRASTYTLIVPRALEATARKILNDGSNFAAAVDGTATQNDVTANIFIWDGFRVELVIDGNMGQPRKDGTIVGSLTNWFVVNKELAKEYEAFKMLTLWNEEMSIYEDDRNKNLYVDLDMSFCVDHYQPEVVVGSTGL